MNPHTTGMIERERHQEILKLLREKRFADVHALCAHTKASEATLRRDLGKLDKQGLVKRVHGGAELLAPSSSLPLADPYREPEHMAAKVRIAKAAVAMIQDGEAVLIDSGSTTFQMCSYLEQRAITVLTNSFPIAEHLYHHSDNTVIIAPGELIRDHQAIYNPFGEDHFARYSIAKTFMGVQGLDHIGATNVDPRVIQAEQQMLKLARQRIILADSSKFGKQGNLRLCNYEEIDCIITDERIDDATSQKLTGLGLELIVV